MSAEVKINVSANAQQAVAGLKSTATEAKNLGSALQDAREKVETFRAKLELLNKTALQGGPGKALAKDLQIAKAELKALESQAGITGEATTNAFSKAYSGIRQLAYILPGIGIAGIFNILGEGLIKLVQNLIPATKAVHDNVEVIKESGKEYQDAVTNVDSLRFNIDLAKKSFLDKNKVVEQYNDTIGKTTGFVHSLDQAEAALNKNAAAYIQFTLLKAAANIALEKAAGQAFEAEKARQQKAKDFQTIGTNLSVFGQGQVSAPGFIPGTDPTAALKAQGEAAAKARQKVIDDAKKQETEFENIAKKFNDDAAKIAKDFKFNFFGDNEQSKPKNTDAELNKQIAAINKEVSALENLSKQGLATGADLNKLFSLKAEKFELEFTKSGLTSNQADRLRDKLQDDLAKALRVNPFTIKINAPKLEIDTTKALTSAIAAGKGIADVTKKGISTGIQSADIGAGLTGLIKTSIANGLIDLGTAIGDVFSGAGLSAILKSVENTVGQFIIDFGKLLIKSGVEISVLKKGLAVLAPTPAVSIAIGLAAVAIGQIIKNASKGPGQMKAFAEGGIVTGPTNALIGEAGTEVVFPLAKLNQFIKGVPMGGGQQVEFLPLRNVLSAGDIHQSWVVQNKRNARTGGPSF